MHPTNQASSLASVSWWRCPLALSSRPNMVASGTKRPRWRRPKWQKLVQTNEWRHCGYVHFIQSVDTKYMWQADIGQYDGPTDFSVRIYYTDTLMWKSKAVLMCTIFGNIPWMLNLKGLDIFNINNSICTLKSKCCQFTRVTRLFRCLLPSLWL